MKRKITYAKTNKRKKEKNFFRYHYKRIFVFKNFCDSLMLLGIFADAFYFSLAMPDNLYFYFNIFSYASFPIFSFLLVEVFHHTKRKAVHLLKIFLIALLSEVPYDLITFEKIFDFEKQNPLLNLAFGFLLLVVSDFDYGSYFKKIFELKKVGHYNFYMRSIFFVGICAASYFLNIEFGWYGIALIFILNFFREKRFNCLWQTITIFFFSLLASVDLISNLIIFLSFIPIIITEIIYKSKQKNMIENNSDEEKTVGNKRISID